MLTQKQKELPYIQIFKLASGEEIIAKVVQEGVMKYIVEKPLQMVMGANGPQFGPFIVMGNPSEQVSLYKSLIMSDVSPMGELETQYESLITGIALPKKSPISI